MLEIKYSFTDEFGQESAIIKTFGEEVLQATDQMDLLIEEFEHFMICAGFTLSGLHNNFKERYSR